MLKLFLIPTVLLGVARHILTTGGGALVAKGTIDASQMEAVTGAVLALLGVALSILKNKDVL